MPAFAGSALGLWAATGRRAWADAIKSGGAGAIELNLDRSNVLLQQLARRDVSCSSYGRLTGPVHQDPARTHHLVRRKPTDCCSQPGRSPQRRRGRQQRTEWMSRCNRGQSGSSGTSARCFRDKDVQSMSSAFDLSSYEDVRANADKILATVADGSMPCDGPWPAERVELFRGWVDAGCPA